MRREVKERYALLDAVGDLVVVGVGGEGLQVHQQLVTFQHAGKEECSEMSVNEGL